MQANNLQLFLDYILNSLENKEFQKITISHKRDDSNTLKNVFAKAAVLKTGMKLSFVYRYPTKDITKNFDFEVGIALIGEILDKDFYQADLFTTISDWHYTVNKNGISRMSKTPPTITEAVLYTHDKIKKRFITLENNVYLRELGIATADAKVKKDMEDKFRQINKYIEIADSIVSSAALPSGFHIVDMGSGKGYLTFALYDYLNNVLKLSAEITGVELRNELVESSNRIAKMAGFGKLKFQTGSIETTELAQIDMLIALHACDTATDDAIYRGIRADSKVIICAPCCHKQVRKQINPENDLKSITKFGILEERQAEILTDGIRALVLEAYGYKTKVFEFISTEHTPKNVLIVGIKKGNGKVDESILDQIKNIKKVYNIQYHQLEKLLHINGQ
ncbi:MAG TPA: methyltransferase [Bacteroidales bacterium]